MKQNKVLANVAQDLTETEKQTARNNIDALSIGELSGFVRADIEQSFTDSQKAQAQENIAAEEYRGNQFDIVQNHAGTGKYCKIAELDMDAHRHDYCYYYFTFCVKFVVNFDASTQSGIERGTFLFSEVDYAHLNVFSDNGKWLEYENAFTYNGESRCIKGMRVLRKKTGLKVNKYELWLEVDDTKFNVAGSISVNVITNIGSWAYNGQSSRSDRGMKSGWFKVYDATQTSQPILLESSYTSLDTETFHPVRQEKGFSIIGLTDSSADSDWAFTDGNIPLAKYNTDRICYPVSKISDKQFIAMYDIRMMQLVKTDGGYQTKFNGAFKIANHGTASIPYPTINGPVLLCKLRAGGRNDLNLWVDWVSSSGQTQVHVYLSVGDYDYSGTGTETTKEITAVVRHSELPNSGSNMAMKEDFFSNVLSNQSRLGICGTMNSWLEATVFGWTNKITGDELDCYKIRVVRSAPIKNYNTSPQRFYGEIELMIPQLGF